MHVGFSNARQALLLWELPRNLLLRARKFGAKIQDHMFPRLKCKLDLALPIFGKPVSGLSFVLKYAVSRLRARISLESCLRIME